MIVLSTGSLYTYGLARVFALAAETGYDGVEVIIDARKDTRDIEYLRRLSSDHGLPIVALHSPFVPDIQGWPQSQLGRLERTVALAKDIEVPLVVAHLPQRFYSVLVRLNIIGYRNFSLPIPWLRRGSFYNFIRGGYLQQMASTSGVIVALENLPVRRFFGVNVNFYRFNRPGELAGFSHLTLDTTHLATWGLDPLEVYSALKQRVVHVHLSNYDGTEHRLPSDGRLALDKFLRRLVAEQYQGAVTVETSPDALNAETEYKCREALARTLSFCRKNFISSDN